MYIRNEQVTNKKIQQKIDGNYSQAQDFAISLVSI